MDPSPFLKVSVIINMCNVTESILHHYCSHNTIFVQTNKQTNKHIDVSVSNITQSDVSQIIQDNSSIDIQSNTSTLVSEHATGMNIYLNIFCTLYRNDSFSSKTKN